MIAAPLPLFIIKGTPGTAGHFYEPGHIPIREFSAIERIAHYSVRHEPDRIVKGQARTPRLCPFLVERWDCQGEPIKKGCSATLEGAIQIAREKQRCQGGC